MSSPFIGAYGPCACGNHTFGPFLHRTILFFNIELYEFPPLPPFSLSTHTHTNLNPFKRNTCKYLLPFSRLPFCFVDGFLNCAKVFLNFWLFFKIWNASQICISPCPGAMLIFSVSRRCCIRAAKATTEKAF